MRYSVVLGVDEETIMFDLVETALTSEALPRQPLVKVYTDHYRDALDDDDRRILGPLGWAYTARQFGNVFEVQDRDGNLIGHVTDTGLRALQHRHFNKVTL